MEDRLPNGFLGTLALLCVCLPGPNESRLRKERNGAIPPLVLECVELEGELGCDGVLLTERCFEGGTMPK